MAEPSPSRASESRRRSVADRQMHGRTPTLAPLPNLRNVMVLREEGASRIEAAELGNVLGE
jgi:hypothetical protein